LRKLINRLDAATAALVHEGIFEVEHHQGKYTFHNEVQGTKVSPK
jgi:hypothetical protein